MIVINWVSELNCTYEKFLLLLPQFLTYDGELLQERLSGNINSISLLYTPDANVSLFINEIF